MKILYKKVIVFLSIILMSSISFAIDVKLPQTSADEVYNGGTSVSTDENFWLNLVNIITKYIWIALAVCSMIALARGGFLLIISQGDDAEFKKANKILIYAIVGIIISLMSYVVTQVIVNFL